MNNRIRFDAEKRVLMTGFSPFGNLITNPSWEGVRSMNKKEVESRFNIRLFREEVEVRYNVVDFCVPILWDQFQPDLIIHAGFDDQAKTFLLETQAQKYDYRLKDEDGLCPPHYQNSSVGPAFLATGLDVDGVCQEFNLSTSALQAAKSNDAGRYLCEYIYYSSLCRSTARTLFVHVPANYSTEQIAQGLERILEICLRHVQHLPPNAIA